MIVRPKKSYLFLTISSLQHMGAFICLWLVNLNVFIQIIITLIMALYYLYTLNRYYFLTHPFSIIRIEHLRENNWQLYFKNGQTSEANLQPSSVITRYITFLHFKDSRKNKKYQLFLFKDSECPKTLKKLRATITIEN